MEWKLLGEFLLSAHSHIKKIVEETAHYEETRFPMDTRPASIADIDLWFTWQGQQQAVTVSNDELFKLNFMPRRYHLSRNYFEKKMDTNQILLFMKSLLSMLLREVNDGIFRAYTSTSAVLVTPTHCNWCFQMLTHADVSGFTHVLLFMELTSWLKKFATGTVWLILTKKQSVCAEENQPAIPSTWWSCKLGDLYGVDVAVLPLTLKLSMD